MARRRVLCPVTDRQSHHDLLYVAQTQLSKVGCNRWGDFTRVTTRLKNSPVMSLHVITESSIVTITPIITCDAGYKKRSQHNRLTPRISLMDCEEKEIRDSRTIFLQQSCYPQGGTSRQNPTQQVLDSEVTLEIVQRVA